MTRDESTTLLRFCLRQIAALGVKSSVALLALYVTAAHAASLDEIWPNLRNPIHSYSNWSIKDVQAVTWQERAFVFFSAFFEDRGQVRCHVVEVETDWQTFSTPIILYDGREGSWNGMCSPNVAPMLLPGADGLLRTVFVLSYNSWGDRAGRPNQLFYRTSEDLRAWSPEMPLARNLTNGIRSIDAALAQDGSLIVLMWKLRQSPRIAFAQSLAGNFRHAAADDKPTFRLADGSEASTFENFQMVLWGRSWHVLATNMADDHMPYLFQRSGSENTPDGWLRFKEGRRLEIPREGFNTYHRANAASFIIGDGSSPYKHLLYSGHTRETRDDYAGRGYNRTGIARTEDLRTYVTPPG